MKRIVKGLIIAGALVLLSACGNSGTQKEQTGDGKQKITFWGSWSGSQVDQLNQLIDQYNKSQDSYTVTYKVQDNVEEKLLTGMAGGEIPDVIMWDRVNTKMYAEKNALLDLDSLIEKDHIDLNDFYEETVKEMNADGKQYGIPLLVDNRSLFYNKKLLAQAGVTPPKTWEELLNVAEKTTKWEGKQLVQAGFSLDDVGLFNMWLQQAGGTMLSEDGKTTAFNSKAGLEVLNFWNQLLNEKKVYQQGFNDGTDAFAAGTVALMYNGPWALADYDKVEGLEYGVVPPVSGPNGDKGALTGGFGLVIPKNAKNKDATWDFIKWWTTNPEIGIEFAKISNWLPANKTAAKDPYFADNEKYKAFVETMDFAKIRPTVTGYSDLEKLAVNPQLENMLAEKETPQQALENAQKQGNKILKEGSSNE
ncbi:ABC transporter substrate-binding protein [Enterococcus villorum]|uniref:ABC transporter substrate-binding protein n=1 Tax=Enterococcus villorum TaxID=112904 RepID=A0A1V8YN61_9ENTE|nr:ABC transporter substrate-binding protein [Enterococcus villorum]OQO68202.1 ABC transporter substrate-binding protein [Enterococcus villorum]OQO73776.1 ABC transporter substrate-binding protein [Enterococcus villorum]